MSRNRYARRRDGNEQSIVDGLLEVGAKVLRLHEFDLLVNFRGRNFPLEVKDPEQRYTQRQKAKRERQEQLCRDFGIPMVETVEQALAAIGAVRGPFRADGGITGDTPLTFDLAVSPNGGAR